MKTKKKLPGTVLMVLLLIVGLYLLQRLLIPKYSEQVIEGNFTAEYYREKADYDILILGDCEVYENISPLALWKEYGITSFIRGNAQQLMGQSYYLLEDSLHYKKPKVVLLSISAMQESNQVNEAYNRMTMDGMKWSAAKVKAIYETKMEEEAFVEYIFPLLRFHGRWKELNHEDIRYIWNRPQVSHNGYYMRADIRPLTEFPVERRRADYRLPEKSYKYLDKIRLLCEEQRIILILYKAPSLYPIWYEQWDVQIEDYAAQHELAYINCIPLIEEIGLDFNIDTYNGGQRLNVYGAEKLSRYLGNYLKQQVELPDHREEKELVAKWQEKLIIYQQMKAEQELEFATYGYLKQFTIND